MPHYIYHDAVLGSRLATFSINDDYLTHSGNKKSFVSGSRNSKTCFQMEFEIIVMINHWKRHELSKRIWHDFCTSCGLVLARTFLTFCWEFDFTLAPEMDEGKLGDTGQIFNFWMTHNAQLWSYKPVVNMFRAPLIKKNVRKHFQNCLNKKKLIFNSNETLLNPLKHQRFMQKSCQQDIRSKLVYKRQ